MAEKEGRAAAAAARRAAMSSKDGTDSVRAAAAAETDEMTFTDNKEAVDAEKRRQAEVQKNLQAKNSSLYEGKRAQERREESGRGVRSKEKGAGRTAQWAKNAEVLKRKMERSETQGGSGREAMRVGGTVPNACRAPVLEIRPDDAADAASPAPGDDRTRRSGATARVRVHFFVSRSANAGAVESFQVQTYRASKFAAGAFVNAATTFRAVRSEITGVYGVPSYGDLVLSPGPHAVRVRAVNTTGPGDWSMQQTIQVGAEEDEEETDESRDGGTAPLDPPETLRKIRAEHASAVAARRAPTAGLAALVETVQGAGWEASDEGWLHRATPGEDGARGSITDSVKLAEMHVRIGGCAAAKAVFSDALTRMKKELDAKVLSPEAAAAHAAYVGGKLEMGADAGAAAALSLSDQGNTMADELAASRRDDDDGTGGALADSAVVPSAQALVAAAEQRQALATERRATLAPWESRLKNPEAFDRIIKAATDATQDTLAWPNPALTPKGKSGAKSKDGSAHAGATWGLPCLAADAVFSTCATVTYQVTAARDVFSATNYLGAAHVYERLERAVAAWNTLSAPQAEGTGGRVRWGAISTAASTVARRWRTSVAGEAETDENAAPGNGAAVLTRYTRNP